MQFNALVLNKKKGDIYYCDYCEFFHSISYCHFCELDH